MFTRFMFTLHRVTGTLLSLLFVVWFVSGIVMMYHGFPRVTADDRLARLEPLDTADLPPVESVLRRVPDSLGRIDGLSVSRYLGQTVFEVHAGDETLRLPADSTQSLPTIDAAYLRRVATAWCDAPIAAVDTLLDLDQWIPFGRLREELPILRFRFADADHTQLYVASLTGEVLQRTTLKERIWAWLGPIPHWVYFTRLRQDADLWRRTVIWLSGIGCIMVIAGLYVGVYTTVQARRRRQKRFIPYKKRWYYWHHLTGLVFGLFTLTWAFSGMMSLADPPEWFMPQHAPSAAQDTIKALAPNPASYPMDYRELFATDNSSINGSIVQIRWTHFFGRPAYEVRLQDEKEGQTLDATTLRPLALTREQVTEAVRRLHASDAQLSTESMVDYDTYYFDRKGRLPLPVYRIRVADADHTTYYINPANGQLRDYSDHRRAGFWMYKGLHSLRFPFLIDHPALWTVVMWVLLLGGTAVSVSGFVLGLRYIGRLFRRKRRGKRKADDVNRQVPM